MKPKTKLFISLLWRDVSEWSDVIREIIATLPMFLVFVATCLSAIVALVLVFTNDAPQIASSAAYAWLAIMAIYGLFKWLKCRWDSLPSKAP